MYAWWLVVGVLLGVGVAGLLSVGVFFLVAALVLTGIGLGVSALRNRSALAVPAGVGLAVLCAGLAEPRGARNGLPRHGKHHDVHGRVEPVAVRRGDPGADRVVVRPDSTACASRRRRADGHNARNSRSSGWGSAVTSSACGEQVGVLDLAAARGAEEPAQPLLVGPVPVSGLALEDVEGGQVAAPFHDGQHTLDAERADQLLLQVVDAREEAERLQVGAGRDVAEPGPS